MPDPENTHEDNAPQAPRRARLSEKERRERKNDTGRLVRYLKRGGAVTRDEPIWRRASRSHTRGFNAHVCVRLLRKGDLILVDGSEATYRLRAELMPADD